MKFKISFSCLVERSRDLICLLAILVLFSCKQEPKNTHLSGPVFGTTYSIKYHSEKAHNFQPQIDSLFKIINQSMSTYIDDSDISKINRNESIKIYEHF